MSSRTFTRRRGSAAPPLSLPWEEELTPDTFTDLDLSSGYSFTVWLYDDDFTAALTKTSGVTGFDGYIQIAWDVTPTVDLDITPGEYSLHCRAVETASGKPRDFDPEEPVTLIITA